MVRGLYTSALGMTTQMNRMDVVTNNIANVDTTGFKKDGVITQTFTEQLMYRINAQENNSNILTPDVGNLTMGLAVDELWTDFSMGRLQETKGSLDVALSENGFFVINTMDAEGNAVERYTRDGSFTLTSNNTLVTNEGNIVMGMNGIIQIPNGDITINADGSIYSGEQFIDRLATVAFENPESLRKFGHNLYDITDESVEMEFDGSILQGFLEGSNVNTINEMVEIINLSRLYETNQRMITIHDTTLQRTVNEIGRK